jgi:hypothetical protein
MARTPQNGQAFAPLEQPSRSRGAARRPRLQPAPADRFSFAAMGRKVAMGGKKMILRRLTANLRAQNWTAIAVEFILLVLGVYLGILAANWNLQRAEREETGRLLSALGTELAEIQVDLDSMDAYYAVSGRYATRALAGWRGDPAVSDNEFVIAAYQASQINGVGTNSSVWADMFGADNLRNIDDLPLRQNLRNLMAFDYDLVDLSAAMSRYREEVRKVIPDAQQDAIRARCGDIQKPNGTLVLPATCGLVLPSAEAARTAAALRARPELVGELNWHGALIATQLQNIETLRFYSRDLARKIARQ